MLEMPVLSWKHCTGHGRRLWVRCQLTLDLPPLQHKPKKKKYTCNEKKTVPSRNWLWLPNRYPLPSRFRAQPWFPDVLQSGTPYCKVLLCTTPYFKILVRTTKCYSVSQKTRKYCCVLHCTSPCYKVRQSTSPTEQTSFTLHGQEHPKLLQCHHILYPHQILRLPQKRGQKVDGTDNPVEPHPHSRKTYKSLC